MQTDDISGTKFRPGQTNIKGSDMGIGRPIHETKTKYGLVQIGPKHVHVLTWGRLTKLKQKINKELISHVLLKVEQLLLFFNCEKNKVLNVMRIHYNHLFIVQSC